MALNQLLGESHAPGDVWRRWIQSHSLHIHLLATPDFFGHESAIGMARDYPEVVRRGLKLQAEGNALMELFGARSVHPVGIKVGGFHHAPSRDQVARMLEQLDEALPLAEELVRWTAAISMPPDEQAFTSVAMREEPLSDRERQNRVQSGPECCGGGL